MFSKEGEFAIASMVCVYSKPENDRNVRSVTSRSAQSSEVIDPIESSIESANVTETCPKGLNFCYILWQYNPIDPMNASLYTVLAKG